MELETILNTLNFSNIIWQILTPIIFSLADILTGFIQAVINKNVDSSLMRNGLLHKILIIIVVFLGFIIDATFSINIVAKIICSYIIIMELTSILENKIKTKNNNVMDTKQKIQMAAEILDDSKNTVKKIKKEKGLIERVESSKTILTEDNRELLRD